MKQKFTDELLQTWKDSIQVLQKDKLNNYKLVASSLNIKCNNDYSCDNCLDSNDHLIIDGKNKVCNSIFSLFNSTYDEVYKMVSMLTNNENTMSNKIICDTYIYCLSNLNEYKSNIKFEKWVKTTSVQMLTKYISL